MPQKRRPGTRKLHRSVALPDDANADESDTYQRHRERLGNAGGAGGGTDVIRRGTGKGPIILDAARGISDRLCDVQIGLGRESTQFGSGARSVTTNDGGAGRMGPRDVLESRTVQWTDIKRGEAESLVGAGPTDRASAGTSDVTAKS